MLEGLAWGLSRNGNRKLKKQPVPFSRENLGKVIEFFKECGADG
jgi:hypothetical protein